MALSLIDHTRKGYRPKNTVVVKAERGGWRTQPVAAPGQFEPGLMVYRFSHRAVRRARPGTDRVPLR
jgi:hypothetical protein